ncbi:MAG: electron transfer flavoprotein subunit alpha [Flavobacteriales bacterium]|nr:electron transfer flavoprotein subunit alpha [Flavobacteriales bacterium]
MSVLAIIENWEGEFKKTSFEVLHYGKKISNEIGKEFIAITFGANNPESLEGYGASKIINISNLKFETTTNNNLAKISAELISENASSHIIISNTITGKTIAPLLSSNLNCGLISNAIEHPQTNNPLTVKCKGFSSKAHVTYASENEKNIISILPNSIGFSEKNDKKSEVLNIDKQIDIANEKLRIVQREKAKGKISLADAEIVISAGRGLKDPDNWGMVEELADLLNAGTACSKPVSDMGWRPHSEHVGQTGLAINPDLYIAIGISGAIQHLAGVNGSKNIVVINIDPEAPFFKAANYGIIGDAFVVVPKLIAALKKFKN